MNHKRRYFVNLGDDAIRTCDVWSIVSDSAGSFGRLVLPKAIGEKVRVAYLRVGNRSVFVGDDPVPGVFFAEGTGAGYVSLRFPANTRFDLRILKDQPLLIEDCCLCLDFDGVRRTAIGWLE